MLTASRFPRPKSSICYSNIILVEISQPMAINVVLLAAIWNLQFKKAITMLIY